MNPPTSDLPTGGIGGSSPVVLMWATEEVEGRRYRKYVGPNILEDRPRELGNMIFRSPCNQSLRLLISIETTQFVRISCTESNNLSHASRICVLQAYHRKERCHD